MIPFGGEFLFVVLIAIILDAIIGDPDWLWRRLPHPVVGFGACISFFERHWNRHQQQSEFAGKFLGALALVILLALFSSVAYAIETVLMALGFVGYAILGLLSATLIAQRSLYDHVAAVARPLSRGDVAGARKAVSMIVGRDPEKLDEAGIARGAIESLAENHSDGIVAPIFWFAVLGFPGLVAYKLVNTADSMIGHRNARYQWFGWGAARLDDFLNLLPARLTMLLLLFSPLKSYGENGQTISSIWRVIMKDAPRHRSPNAGWPEAAMAGRLNIALSGPRYYGDQKVDEPFVNADGQIDIGGEEIRRALRLYRSACVVMAGLIAIGALFSV